MSLQRFVITYEITELRKIKVNFENFVLWKYGKVPTEVVC